MKKIFSLPMVEVVSFQTEDIICTSGGSGTFFGPLHDDIYRDPTVVLPEIGV